MRRSKFCSRVGWLAGDACQVALRKHLHFCMQRQISADRKWILAEAEALEAVVEAGASLTSVLSARHFRCGADLENNLSSLCCQKWRFWGNADSRPERLRHLWVLGWSGLLTAAGSKKRPRKCVCATPRLAITGPFNAENPSPVRSRAPTESVEDLPLDWKLLGFCMQWMVHGDYFALKMNGREAVLRNPERLERGTLASHFAPTFKLRLSALKGVDDAP